MTNGQSSRVIAASGTDRRIRLRRPAPAGTPPTAPGRQTPAAADRPRHGRRLRPRQTNPGHDRQTPAAADRPRPQQTDPGRSRQTPAAADKPRHATRFNACKKCCMSHRPAAAPVSRRRGLPLLKPTAAPVNRHSSRPSLKPSPAPLSDRGPTCCHPIRSQPRPAAARPLSTQKNAASPTGRGIPGCRHRLPYSHSIVAGGLEEMS